MNQHEVEFTLPKGYFDKDGVCHKTGVMRMATAADELLPMRDPRVLQNPAYLSVLILSRVIVKLGELTSVDAFVIENLFTADYNYLQEVYQKLNGCVSSSTNHAVCPNCGMEFEF